ncbi:MAG: YggT family protein [Chloroflexi bacterium]|nr:YggT family protein [Chloroflexota bacterium]
MGSLINAIEILSFILTLIVLADIVVSYFVDPSHPIRQTLDSIVSPVLTPIRNLMPQTGMFDFSPLILLIIIRLVENILIRILRGFA